MIATSTRVQSQPGSYATHGQSVGWFASVQKCFNPRPKSRHRNFSLLRFVSLASLFGSVRGQLFPAKLELSSLDGTLGFVLNGERAGDRCGRSVSGAGDINGDGIADFLVGARDEQETAGKTYVVFGAPGLGAQGSIDVASLNGTNGFILLGEQKDDDSGSSVSGAGDVNADGVSDLLIGAHLANQGAGRTYVVFGRADIGASGFLQLSELNGTNGFAIIGEGGAGRSGWSVASAGDINGDGIADIVIGAKLADASGRQRAGKTYVVFGKAGFGGSGFIDLSKLKGDDGFILNGERAGDESGYSVSSGDINADGISDLLMGAWVAGQSPARENAGMPYVVFGNRGIGGTLELLGPNATDNFRLEGKHRWEQSGTAVSVAGDVNADGVDDFLSGALSGTPSSRRGRAGKTYVVFGKADLGSSRVLGVDDLNGTNGFVLAGENSDDQSGVSVSSAGDVNGDGVMDLLVGAWGADPVPSRSNAGKTYVIFGKPGLGGNGTIELSTIDGTNGFVLHGDKAGDESGHSVANAGDVNADGVDDLLIGSRLADLDGGGLDAGKVYIVFGRRLGPTTRSSPTTSASLPRGSTPERAMQLESTASFLPVSSSLEPLSLGLPLRIAGGVCAVISSVASAFIVWRCRRKQNPSADSEPECEVRGYQQPPASSDTDSPNQNRYTQLQLYPKGHTHYIPIDEVNRQHDEYESIKAADASGYAIWPQNRPSSHDATPTPQGCARVGQ